MKLYNRTRCPDTILEPLLVAAGRAVGARTVGVIGKITSGSRGTCSGHAKSAGNVRLWFLNGTRHDGDPAKARRVSTDRGYFRIVLPGKAFGYDPLAQAERFYAVACHEWAHVRDFQDGARFGDYNRRWANRPHERRAITAALEARNREDTGELKRRDDLILALAIWMDSR